MKNSLNSRNRYVLAVDPAGNYKEGNGTTGIALYDREADKIIETLIVEAHAYDEWQAYFKGVWNKIRWTARDYSANIVIVVEDYILYATKANAQINSCLETPRLIGYLLMKAYEHEIPTALQRAVDVKTRWSDDVLEHKGYIHRVSNKKTYEHCHGLSPYAVTIGDDYEAQLMSHNLDAIRHAVHYGKFGKE